MHLGTLVMEPKSEIKNERGKNDRFVCAPFWFTKM